MGRGVSAGGGQSSLGYLFGGEEPANNSKAPQKQSPQNESQVSNETLQKSAGVAPPVDNNKQIPAGVHSNNQNNYLRADGQNCGNFLTGRPSTKVHAAPGGGSSLDYLFGGGGK